MNVVVTGSNKGLGLEITRQLLKKDGTNKVYGICRRTSPALDELAINSGGKLIVVEKMDVSSDGVMQDLQDYFKDIPVGLVIHNAGAFLMRWTR
jgi:NAD(P)-dependent dehydrogenase (short-subunit alcohol dehydrogenase family)